MLLSHNYTSSPIHENRKIMSPSLATYFSCENRFRKSSSAHPDEIHLQVDIWPHVILIILHFTMLHRCLFNKNKGKTLHPQKHRDSLYCETGFTAMVCPRTCRSPRYDYVQVLLGPFLFSYLNTLKRK